MTDIETRDTDSVRDALLRLPRVPASPGFTSRLRQRVARQQASRPVLRYRLAAAAGLVVVAGSLVLLHHDRSRKLEAQSQRAALAQRYQDLSHELARVRERAARSPRLYVATASDVDLVLDLEPWMDQPFAVQHANSTTPRP